MRILLLVALSVYSFSAFACKCKTLPELSIGFAKGYEVIAEVSIDSVSECNINAVAWCTAKQLFRGKEERFAIEFDCSSSCSLAMEKGEIWLIYANKKDKKLRIDFCDRNRKHITNQDDFYAAVLLMSYDDEIAFLKNNIGIKNLADQQGKDITQREVLQTSMLNKLLLVLASIVFFIVLLFFLKRMK
jgi:hypothetical protein